MKRNNIERNVEPQKLLKMFFPANYADEEECRNYLHYKYGIIIDQVNDTELSAEDLITDLYERSLKLISNYIDEPLIDSYAQWDILYLLIKEYLYFYCMALKTKRTDENPYSESKLAKIFTPIQNDSEQYAKTLEKYYKELENEPAFSRFKEAEFYSLFESQPYNIIAYNLIGLSHENSWLLYSRKNWPSLKHKELPDRITQYLRYGKLFGEDELINILKIEISLDTLINLFEDTLTTLKDAYGKHQKNYDWASYSQDQKTIAINLLYSFFSKIYDEKIKEITAKDKYLWANLDQRKVDPYKTEITNLFLSYLEIMHNNRKSKKGSSIGTAQWLDYVVALQEAYDKIFPLNQQPSNIYIYICRYASALWINELLIPTLSVIEFIHADLIGNSLTDALNDDDVTELGYLCFNLVHCPNTFIRETLLNNFTKYEYIEEWNSRLAETVDWLSKVYYPLLETVFHLQFKHYFHDLDSLELFLQNLPSSFFDDFLKKYRRLFDIISDLGDKRTKNLKKVNALGSKKSIIAETFLDDYLHTYGAYKEITNVKINTPVTVEELLS